MYSAQLVKRGARCLLITIRDPVDRLISGWRMEGAHHHRGAFLKFAAPKSDGFLSNFVDAFSNFSHPDHSRVMQYWAASIGQNGFFLHDGRPAKPGSRGQLGSQFLKAQTSYLEQGPADGVTLHFLCLERLSEDMSSLCNVARCVRLPC